MILNRVTITGADTSVAPWQLAELSAEFPFVEWGILFSLSQVGSPRFPTLDWVRSLIDGRINYSAHLCGRYVRDLVLEANFTWYRDLAIPVGLFDRVQLNFHGQFHRQHRNLDGLLRGTSKRYIFQCDGVNDDAVRALCDRSDDQYTPLFDTSGGAGRLPSEWPDAWPSTYCGYAGGLGPENVLAQLEAIRARAHGKDIWIDMERRVRSADDRTFDLAKVRDVLTQCAAVITP